MEIKIEKEKAKRKLILEISIESLSTFLFSLIPLFFIKFLLYEEVESKFINLALSSPSIITISIIATAIYFCCNYFFKINLYLKSLEYNAEESRLTKSYKIIETRKDTAKLQVINSVDIIQDWKDRIFGIYTLKVDYGFGAEGYVFDFNFLTLEDAEKISDLIKPSGRIKIGIE